MRAVSEVSISRNTLDAVVEIERVHTVNADQQNVLNLAGLGSSREWKHTHHRQSHQYEGEKTTIEHCEPPGIQREPQLFALGGPGWLTEDEKHVNSARTFGIRASAGT